MQENWSGLQFPSPGDLPHPGIKPTSLVSLVLGGRFLTITPSGKPQTADIRGIQNWTQVSVETERNPMPPPRGQGSLCVPCLSLVEKLKSPRLPRITKEQVQAANHYDQSPTLSI